MKSLELLSEHCRAETAKEVASAAAKWGMEMPGTPAQPLEGGVDVTMAAFHSDLAVASALPLADFVRLLRGQTAADSRPNKDLYELPLPRDPALHEAARRWNEVVRHGVVPEWLSSRPTRQTSRPRNHGSIDEHLPQVWEHIRKGQADGRYLVVRASLLDQWQNVFISPIGVVAKDGTDIRVIDDYSFSEGESINDFTDRTHLPEIKYNPPGDIARRIFELRRDYPDLRILMILGDVAGAFRHVPISAGHAHMFAFVLGEYLVVDLACGFGWCGSPAWYFLPGTLINGLYEASPCVTTAGPRPLTGLFWCDDHTCIEPEDDLRCFQANLALRRAMATVLGPKAINTRKFTQWGEQGRALGLLWDTSAGTVTIPAEKISKAQQRVQALLDTGTTTKTTLLQLLGSLRHVASCCPPARAFYQRLQTAATTSRRYRRHQLSADALQDLTWFRYILLHPGRFNGIPVSQFAGTTTPLVDVHMGASDEGLCALEPTLRQFIRVRFSEDTKQEFRSTSTVNSINARELQSAVLATLLWGPVWLQRFGHRPIHVRFWIDNASAVSWTQRRASRQPRAQVYNRLLSIAEFQYSLICTASHVPGVDNVMADAGPSPRGLRESLTLLGSMLRGRAIADTTSVTYRNHWRQWSQFSAYMQWSEWLSVDRHDNSTKLGLFAIFCGRHGWRGRNRGNQYGTIQLELASIRYHKRYAGIEVQHAPDLDVLLRGIRRLSGPLTKKQPITPAFLRLLRRRLDFSQPRQRLLWGSVLLAYFFLLRRSEYLIVESGRHPYCLKSEHVHFSDHPGVRVHYLAAEAVTIGLAGAKNDQFGRGAWRTMHATGDPVLCPTKALYHVLRARVELRRDAAPNLCADLSTGEVSDMLKAVASSIGVDPRQYATHSVRIGGATALLSGKADSLAIKLLGRWLSNTYESYPVLAPEATLGLSSRMI